MFNEDVLYAGHHGRCWGDKRNWLEGKHFDVLKCVKHLWPSTAHLSHISPLTSVLWPWISNAAPPFLQTCYSVAISAFFSSIKCSQIYLLFIRPCEFHIDSLVAGSHFLCFLLKTVMNEWFLWGNSRCWMWVIERVVWDRVEAFHMLLKK